jgi:hypothetical protein
MRPQSTIFGEIYENVFDNDQIDLSVTLLQLFTEEQNDQYIYIALLHSLNRILAAQFPPGANSEGSPFTSQFLVTVNEILRAAVITEDTLNFYVLKKLEVCIKPYLIIYYYQFFSTKTLYTSSSLYVSVSTEYLNNYNL